jgi:hypothetical protein
MALLTSTEVRTHVETGIVDAALQRIMDGAEQDIDQRYGAVGAQVDDLPSYGVEDIFTTRPILTITSVAETIGDTTTTLATDDYEQKHGQMLHRLGTGTNGRIRWGDSVLVTYAPVDTTDRRIVAYIALIKLYVVVNGLGSERMGDFSSNSLDYNVEREKILRSLGSPGGFF